MYNREKSGDVGTDYGQIKMARIGIDETKLRRKIESITVTGKQRARRRSR